MNLVLAIAALLPFGSALAPDAVVPTRLLKRFVSFARDVTSMPLLVLPDTTLKAMPVRSLP